MQRNRCGWSVQASLMAMIGLVLGGCVGTDLQSLLSGSGVDVGVQSKVDDDRCRLEGELDSGVSHPLASGKGKFESRGDRLRLSVEVEDLAGDYIGTDAWVTVGGEDLGAIEIVCINPLATPACTLGGFDLNLDSRDGDAVPDLVGMDDCSAVSVMFTVTDLDGHMVGSGTLIDRNEGDSDSPEDGDDNGDDGPEDGDDNGNDGPEDGDDNGDDGPEDGDDNGNDGPEDGDDNGDDGPEDGDDNGDDGPEDGDDNGNDGPEDGDDNGDDGPEDGDDNGNDGPEDGDDNGDDGSEDGDDDGDS